MHEPLDKKHYRAVRALFKETFDPKVFTTNSLNISWHYRSKSESYAFLDPSSKNFIGFIITSYHRKNKDNLYVDYIALDPAYRGKGIGTAIVNEFLEEIKMHRRSIHLFPERRELYGWYERLGFYKTHNGYYNFHSYDTRSVTKACD
uniref:N-acetyltransferase domain-containing protein n=1 Tax=viral metagenome TaxID=1070528 RepID=A0A6C0AN17_9ZZZZ